MAVLKSNDGHEFILDCNCGCDDGFKLKFTFDEFDFFKDTEDPNLEELLGTDMCYGLLLHVGEHLKTLWDLLFSLHQMLLTS